jgi:SMODS and SLOG-associating 2TM effector domain family 5
MTISDLRDRESNRKDTVTNIAAEKLLHSLKSTSASRFNAAKRLTAKDRALTRLTAFTSAYLIILTTLPYFMKLPQEVTDNLSLLTVVFSIIVLVSSLLQYSSGDVVSAEQHHRAGLEMSEIARELAIKLPIIQDTDLLTMAGRYSATLQKYSINHDDVDFLRYQMENQDKYPWLTWSDRFSIRVQTFAVKHVYSAVLITITVLLVGLGFGYAYPSRLPVSDDPVSIQAKGEAAA